MGNYFANKEIFMFQFWENIKTITSQSLMRNKLGRKKFWKTVTTFYQKMVQSLHRIILTKAVDFVITHNEEVAKELKNIFSEAVKNLKIPNYEKYDSLSVNIDHPILKAKWENHPDILEIASENKNMANFSFNFISKEDEITMLDNSKVFHEK